MTKTLYRVLNKRSGEYISDVAGFIRYEDYVSPHTSFVYDLQDALAIKRIGEKIYKLAQKDNSYTKKEREKYTIPILVKVNIDDVPLSFNAIKQAIDSAPLLGLTGTEAVRQARWQRVRRYKEYLHYDLTTLTHNYIYNEGIQIDIY